VNNDTSQLEGHNARPLDGVKVIEMAGLAPSPYCGMLLADFGADVVVVDRPSKGMPEIPNLMAKNPFDRGKRFIRVNLKTKDGVDIVKKMMERYDVLIEPYRPGVMESLGLGPEEALKMNPKLIYARLTGWGQAGPYASMAGHDIDTTSSMQYPWRLCWWRYALRHGDLIGPH